MDFAEAVKYLLGLGHETLTIKLGLRNTELLLEALQHPQRSFPSVQIAGTNGKGSTAAFLDSICRSASIKTGLYTSPHLQSITERIKIDGINISEADFARHTTKVEGVCRSLVSEGILETLPTFFEQVTAIALVAFREAGIELAILETGLGGRLDSTTAANAAFCAITTIAFDHEEYLGQTIEEIAAEKAAIIRPGSNLVIGPQLPQALEIILKRCAEVGVVPRPDRCQANIEAVSPDGRFLVTFEVEREVLRNVWLRLRGRHQVENAAIAIQLGEMLAAYGFPISSRAIVEGLETAVHPGRLELIEDQPVVLLDGAHNPAGAKTLKEFLVTFGRHPLTIVFGAMRDKRLGEIAETIFPIADHLVLTEVQNPRTATSETLAELATGSYVTTTNSTEAMHAAHDRTPKEGMICVTGSLYLIGEIRGSFVERKYD